MRTVRTREKVRSNNFNKERLSGYTKRERERKELEGQREKGKNRKDK